MDVETGNVIGSRVGASAMEEAFYQARARLSTLCPLARVPSLPNAQSPQARAPAPARSLLVAPYPVPSFLLRHEALGALACCPAFSFTLGGRPDTCHPAQAFQPSSPEEVTASFYFPPCSCCQGRRHR